MKRGKGNKITVTQIYSSSAARNRFKNNSEVRRLFSDKIVNAQTFQCPTKRFAERFLLRMRLQVAIMNGFKLLVIYS